MNSGEFTGTNPEYEAEPAAWRLIRYLRGRFAAAYEQMAAGSRQGEMALHGSFVQRVPIDVGHALTKGADRIVMKPPHPRDEPGYYCEAYLILFQSDREYIDRQEIAEHATKFLVREFVDHLSGPPFWLVDEDGVHPVEVDLEKIHPSMESTSATAQNRAEEMLERISTYNIVASSDADA
jgi:hypothetical protein